MQCEVEGCEREAKTHRYGHLCLMHYKRYVRHGDVKYDGTRERNKQKIAREHEKCKYCDRLVGRGGAFGMCNKHYQMFRLHGDPLYFDKRVGPTSHGYYRVGANGQHEHRKIYEDHIGRKLLPTEIIHHIDFNKTNNRIENLYLYPSRSEHLRVHRHYNELKKQLKDGEVIKFKDGDYYTTNI